MRVLASAALRFVSIVAVIAALAGLIGLLAVAAGSDAARTVALVLYIVGAALGIVGFAAGTRGPLRPLGGSQMIPKAVRRASVDEIVDTMSTSAFLVVTAVVLMLIGIAVDPRYDLI